MFLLKIDIFSSIVIKLYFSRNTLDNSFHLFYKLNESILLMHKYTKIFVLCWFFLLAFRYSLWCTSSLLNCFLMILLTFSQISLYISKKSSSFYQRIQTFGFIKPSFINTHFWTEYTWRSTFFNIFVTNEIHKILFTERKLIRSLPFY